ncbi:MAG: tetratricopeptide repeat protein [Treponema sp.]|jgi:tetratricopeptide (TPR) repeat protein|nr:tetratricopeptide repeat protein [Treponema sp.]
MAITEDDYDLVIEHYSNVIHLNPADAEAYFDRAEVYLKSGADSCSEEKLRLAYEDLKKGLKLNPNSERAQLVKYILGKSADP